MVAQAFIMLQEKSAQRLYFWDNFKGMLMFFVVFGHALMPYISSQPMAFFIFKGIYYFHMPAFVFISGYFSSFVSDKRKSLIKLCLAYLIFNYLMMLYAGYVLDLPFKFLEPYYSNWYLLALIIWRLLDDSIIRKWWLLPLSILLAVIIGYWNDIDNTLAMSRIIGFLPFYIAGYQVSNIDINKYLIKKKSYINIVWGFAAIAFLVSVDLLLNNISFNDLIWQPYESNSYVLNRFGIIFTAIVMIMFLLKIIPERKIPWLSEWGKNSLAILVLHRFVLFVFAALLTLVNVANYLYLVLLLISIITMVLLGNNKVGTLFNNFLNYLYLSIFGRQQERRPKIAFMFTMFLIIVLSLPVFSHTNIGLSTQKAGDYFKVQSEDPIHPVLSKTQMNDIDNAISIAFIGDQILLQDQVREAWSQDKREYDFDPVFEYAKTYLQEADYTIGVLEGPLAGEEAGYSTSNYDDGIPMYLNFPDSFAKAVARGGVDLVTVANNHLLDKDVAGAMRTLDILDQLSLNHVGAYRNQQEKDAVKIIEIEGLRLAVLAYTIPNNYYDERYYFEENNVTTSIIVDKTSPYFKQALNQVKTDFAKAKRENPDFIIVLPHMGTQFIHETDKFQELWNEIFIQNGADIIFADHSHAVQPIEFRSIEEDNHAKTAIIVNCPGNFVNSYTEYNGDATSIVKVYLNPKDKNIICAGVVPMWTYAPINNIHQALPIYNILHNKSLGNQISRYEMKRVDEVQKIVTSVMLKAEITLDQAQDIYYIFPEGYFRQPAAKLIITEDIKESEILKLIAGKKNACFVGDSITEGSKNGGYGWFEPLAESIEGLKYTKRAWPGATTITLLENIEDIYSDETDIYIIAIGINDIRYRNKNICAMTSEEYIENIDKLVEYIFSRNGNADFVFISPWPVLSDDTISKLTSEQKDVLLENYTTDLENYCNDKNILFVNPYNNISNVLNKEIPSKYLIDYIHPNAHDGISLYSKSVVSDLN